MQNPLTEYRNNMFSTHESLKESFSYLNSMLLTVSASDRIGVNTAVHCLINTIAKEIDKVYHPTNEVNVASLVDKYLNDVLAERVEEIVNDRISDAIGEYMSNEFDICDYEDNIDWEYRITGNINSDTLRESVRDVIKDELTFEVRVS